MSNEKTGYGAKAIIIIGAFASIISAIVAIASYTYLSPLIVHSLIVFLFIATIVIIVWLFAVRPLINFYKNRRETKKNNKIVKRFFEEFEENNFIDNFKLFITDDSTVKPYAFHFVIANMLNREEFRGKIPVPPINLISLYFNHWTGAFNRSDRTKKDFDLVFHDFENILHEYYKLFIEKPIKAIRNVGAEVPECFKIDWKKAVDDYNAFARDWNNFCKRVRKGFGVRGNFDIRAFQGIMLAEEL